MTVACHICQKALTGPQKITHCKSCGTTFPSQSRSKHIKCTECTYKQTDAEVAANYEDIKIRDMKKWGQRERS